ncbi:hypothetical protein BZG01_06530 [Labilibaculum manganireducens]|uniref:Uncharacterized protein n=1 Tax=Labilibaculum manganireducens TaxID=1940525 RepID=A0A2N3IBQ7_9BACT|nr:hypothetical protein BZG01_06530 [Labilibaculum manganireducens]
MCDNEHKLYDCDFNFKNNREAQRQGTVNAISQRSPIQSVLGTFANNLIPSKNDTLLTFFFKRRTLTIVLSLAGCCFIIIVDGILVDVDLEIMILSCICSS